MCASVTRLSGQSRGRLQERTEHTSWLSGNTLISLSAGPHVGLVPYYPSLRFGTHMDKPAMSYYAQIISGSLDH